MADIHVTTSAYDTGTADSYTTLVDDTDDVVAAHQNGPASAIVAIETILGTGTTLKGSAADLATRLSIALETSGKLKSFSGTTKTTFPPAVTEGCTGNTTFTDDEVVYYKEDTSGNTIRSSGYGLPGTAGATGELVGRTQTQTLTAKTLTTPTIADFTNATHDHTNAAGGGILTGNSDTGSDATFTTTLTGSSVDTTATCTVTNQTGAKIIVAISGHATVTNTPSTQVEAQIIEGASTVLTNLPISPVGVNYVGPFAVSIVTPQTAASHTYKLAFTGDGCDITAINLIILAYTIV